MTAKMRGQRDSDRFAPMVEHLHGLGPRPLAEFLEQLIGCDDGIRLDVQILLEQYRRLSPEAIDALDARDIRPPLMLVGGGGRR